MKLKSFHLISLVSLTGIKDEDILKHMGNETSTNEIMEFLQEHMVTKDDLNNVQNEFKQDLAKLKSELVDAMDDKNADLKGDLVILMRKEDKKVVSLINLLHSKKLITEEEASEILSMDPFPKML